MCPEDRWKVKTGDSVTATSEDCSLPFNRKWEQVEPELKTELLHLIGDVLIAVNS